MIDTLPMSVKLKELFILDLRKIAMEILLQIIPNNPKVVHNTPRNIRFRKISLSERDIKVILVHNTLFINVGSTFIIFRYFFRAYGLFKGPIYGYQILGYFQVTHLLFLPKFPGPTFIPCPKSNV